MLKYSINSDGTLCFKLDPVPSSLVKEDSAWKKAVDNYLWEALIKAEPLHPEDCGILGALDPQTICRLGLPEIMPVLCLIKVDAASKEVSYSLWYFPSFLDSNPIEELCDEGEVCFWRLGATQKDRTFSQVQDEGVTNEHRSEQN